MYTETELKPVDGRKSFGQKAYLIENNTTFKLRSYNTITAEYNKLSKKLTVHGYFSATSARHLQSFLAFLGLPAMTKKEIEASVNNDKNTYLV